MKRTIEETITDWVIENFLSDSDDKNPNHCQFSAAEVAHIIMAYRDLMEEYYEIQTV